MSARHEGTQCSANLVSPVSPTRTDLVGPAPRRRSTAGRPLAHQKSMKPNSNVAQTLTSSGAHEPQAGAVEHVQVSDGGHRAGRRRHLRYRPHAGAHWFTMDHNGGCAADDVKAKLAYLVERQPRKSLASARLC